MKKHILFLLAASALLLCYFWFWSLPVSTPLKPRPIKATQDVILLPLDSRPVCSTMVQKLGRLAGLNVILPPKDFLDNYQEPAKSENLLLWLQKELQNTPKAIISADILLHGGLLHTRQHKANAEEQQKVLQAFASLPPAELDIFSIIPRLLVSDQVYPDTWYWYHLMRYSTLTDQMLTFNDFHVTQQLEEITAQIPADMITKYQSLYKSSTDFNNRLLYLANEKRRIVIGQDDSNPFGLPHRSAMQLQQQLLQSGTPHAQLAYGADELSALLLARIYLENSGFRPKIHLLYSDPRSEFLYMPYMAASTGATLRNQMRMLEAEQVEKMDVADIILYINCGNDDFKPNKEQAEDLQKLLDSGKHIGLIDLSANFVEEELLMPKLLEQNVTINRLSAYAGWNTFSNSSGTALAQAVIFAGRCKELASSGKHDLLTSLYAQNLDFICERLLDDYVYQKTLHANLGAWLSSFGYTATDLDKGEGLPLAEAKVQTYLALQAFRLLHRNLGQNAFYEDGNNEYMLRNLTVGSRLPWGRIFEVELQVGTEYGIVGRK